MKKCLNCKCFSNPHSLYPCCSNPRFRQPNKGKDTPKEVTDRLTSLLAKYLEEDED